MYVYKNLKKWYIAFFTFIFLFTLVLIKVDLLLIVEDALFLETNFKFFNHYRSASSKVILIEANQDDFYSLTPIYGKWPFNKNILLQMFQYIFSGKPQAIIVAFDEFPQLMNVLPSEEELDLEDQFFTEVNQFGNISFAARLIGGVKDFESIDLDLKNVSDPMIQKYDTKIFNTSNIRLATFEDVYSFYPGFLGKNPATHILNYNVSESNIVYSLPLLGQYKNLTFPSAALQAARSFLKNSQIHLTHSDIFLGGQLSSSAPIDKKAFFHLYYYPTNKGVNTLTFSQIITSFTDKNKKDNNPAFQSVFVPETDFTDKVVFMGSQSFFKDSIKDINGNKRSIAWLHATAASNLIENHFLTKASPWITVLWIILFLVAVFIARYFIVSFYLFLASLLILGSVLQAASFLMFDFFLTQMPQALFLLISGCILLFELGLEFFVRRPLMQNILIRWKFHFPEKLLKTFMIKNTISSSFNPVENKTSIVMFERTNHHNLLNNLSFESFSSYLSLYLTQLTDILYEAGGYIEILNKDGATCLWGGPFDADNLERKAVTAALFMKKRLSMLINGASFVDGFITKTIFAVHVGEVQWLEVQQVNKNYLASFGKTNRDLKSLVQVAKLLPVGIVTSHEVMQATSHVFIYRKIPGFILPGNLVYEGNIFEVLCEVSSAEKAQWELLVHDFDQAVALCEAQNYTKAVESFTRLYDSSKDPLVNYCLNHAYIQLREITKS